MRLHGRASLLLKDRPVIEVESEGVLAECSDLSTEAGTNDSCKLLIADQIRWTGDPSGEQGPFQGAGLSDNREDLAMSSAVSIPMM